MKELQFNYQDIQEHLANKIAVLELNLANEKTQKNAVVKYAEELEQKLNKTDENAK